MGSRSVLLLESNFATRRSILEMFQGDSQLVFLGVMPSQLKAVKMLQAFLPQIFLAHVKFLTEDFVKMLIPFFAGGEIGFVAYGDEKDRHEALSLVRRHLKTSFSDYVPLGSCELEQERLDFRKALHQILSPPHRNVLGIEEKLIRKEKILEQARTLATHVVVIGSSAGGPRILRQVLSKFPEDIPAGVLLVQHIEDPFTGSLVSSLARDTLLSVCEAQDNVPIYNGCVYVAPGGFHLEILPYKYGGGMCVLKKTAPVYNLRPTVDNLMLSVPRVYGKNVVGIILTGMGRDGVLGMKAIKMAGGMTIAQDKATSMVFGMPKAVIESGCVDRVLPYTRIPTVVSQYFEDLKLNEKKHAD